jgi:SH3-like domain-containing protein
MFNRTLKTVAIAATVVLATASASMAATWAWVDHDTNVYLKHKNSSPVVGYAHEGQKVKVLDTYSNWVKIKVSGDIGWVKENKLDWAPYPVSYPSYGFGGYGGGSFCAEGKSASFCLSVGY